MFVLTNTGWYTTRRHANIRCLSYNIEFSKCKVKVRQVSGIVDPFRHKFPDPGFPKEAHGYQPLSEAIRLAFIPVSKKRWLSSEHKKLEKQKGPLFCQLQRMNQKEGKVSYECRSVLCSVRGNKAEQRKNYFFVSTWGRKINTTRARKPNLGCPFCVQRPCTEISIHRNVHAPKSPYTEMSCTEKAAHREVRTESSYTEMS